MRTGMAPLPVSYQQAFEQLLKAASARGGEAIVLRGHEAQFFTKGARIARRPTFLELRGSVVNLQAHGQGCNLVELDPVEFEHEALAREGESLEHSTGVAF
ncbi:hypothetical protein [Stenotrophomonas sp. SY1]|uniref:hypothetical protein n=1 Tax=Stenotrophomonas sp. SY1 TaxID=477235 RepID=UPI001E3F1D93|nr:hypothetical protein [Stenotrophomonas sp. SY1]MCD9087858.1 hypothetical protein [Stenotrophomonas sp. SY1]